MSRMKTTLTMLAAAFSIAAVTLASAQQGPGGGPPPAPVRVATAAIESLAPVTEVPGTVRSVNDARVAAEVEGQLELVADVGTVVAQGDEVAHIEDTQIRLRVEELRAQVLSEDARLKFLQSEEKRLSRLATANNAAQSALEQIQRDKLIAESDLRIARTRLAQERDRLNRTSIKAPFDGVVVERMSRVGERVGVGMQVVRMLDPNSLEVVARPPLEYMAYMQPGMDVTVRSRLGDASALVRTVVAVGDENTHVFEVRLDLNDVSWPAGQTVRVDVPMATPKEVLAVPRDALVLRRDGITVFKVNAEGMAERVGVVTGVGDGSMIEITGDIAPGDQVVVRGNERLRPGQPVMVQNAPG